MHSVIKTYRKCKKDLDVVRNMYKEYQAKFERDFAEDIAQIEEHLSRERQKTVQQQQSERQPPAPEQNQFFMQNVTDQEPPPGEPVELNFQVQDAERPPGQPTGEKVAQVNYPPGTADAHDSASNTSNASASKCAQKAAPKYRTSKDSIKKLYRTLCKKFHPDSNAGDETYSATFVEIQKAYESGNEEGLIEIGLEKGMNMDMYIENPEELCTYWTNKIEEIRQEINHMQATIVWVWNITTDERKRAEMRPQMVNKIRERAGSIT